FGVLIHMLLDMRSIGDAPWSVPGDDRVVAASVTAEDVFNAHATRVYNLARRMLNNDADAEDVTQEVLLQVVRKLDTFRGDAELTAGLHGVAVTAAPALRRSRARRPELLLAAPLETLAAAPVGRRTVLGEPSRDVLDKETQELVERAIAELPAMYRDVYVL